MKSASVVLGVVAMLIVAGGGCQGQQKEPAPTPAVAKTEPAPQPNARPPQAQAQPPAPSPHAVPQKPAPADQGDESDSPTGLHIQFGIMPGDYSDPNKGILVGEVTPGTGAADAGIKADDRLMTWNGEEITNVYKWMDLMSRHKPGDVVTVGVLRDGKTIPMKVTLKARE